MTVHDLLLEAAAKGIRDFGLTDHIHTPFNLPDLDKSKAEFTAAQPPAHVRFGVEVSCVSTWELDQIAKGAAVNPVYGIRGGGPPGSLLALGLTAADVKRLGIEYVVGGTHWPMYVALERQTVIRDYHRQNMFLACHPLVDIVAHPWWWMGHWQDADKGYRTDPWFDDFHHIPESLHVEFADAVKRHGKKVEINLAAMLLNPHYPERFKKQYLDYLAGLNARGVALSIGSDCHNRHYDIDFETAARMLDSVGISDEDLWVLPPKA